MQPYIPYFVIEAIVADREREIHRLRQRSAFRFAAEARRRSGAMLIRIGRWLQEPIAEPMPKAA